MREGGHRSTCAWVACGADKGGRGKGLSLRRGWIGDSQTVPGGACDAPSCVKQSVSFEGCSGGGLERRESSSLSGLCCLPRLQGECFRAETETMQAQALIVCAWRRP